MKQHPAKRSLLSSRRAQQATALVVAVSLMTTAVLIDPGVVFAKKKNVQHQQTTSQVQKAKNGKNKAQKLIKSTPGQQQGSTTPVAPAAIAAPATAAVPVAAAAAQSKQKAPFESLVLTADGSDTFDVSSTNSNGMYMTAPASNTDVNLRQVMWKNTSGGKQSLLNSQTCATWVSESTDMLQEGLALRVFHNDRTGRTKALTLTKNTIFGIHWQFNVLSWDTNRKGDPWLGIKQFDMSSIMFDEGASQMKPMPWRVCARADGSKFTFKIWFPDSMKEPSWSDKTYTRSVKIPRDFMIPGKTGWYIGHIPAGGNATYSNLTTKKL